MPIVAAEHHKQENPNLVQTGSENGLVGDLFVKFSKIVLKSLILNKKLVQWHSRQFKILKKIFSHCPSLHIRSLLHYDCGLFYVYCVVELWHLSICFFCFIVQMSAAALFYHASICVTLLYCCRFAAVQNATVRKIFATQLRPLAAHSLKTPV